MTTTSDLAFVMLVSEKLQQVYVVCNEGLVISTQ